MPFFVFTRLFNFLKNAHSIFEYLKGGRGYLFVKTELVP